MGELKRKAINFDLDTNEMKVLGIYPDGYRQLRKSFEKQGFLHRQGSGYASKSKISSNQVMNIIEQVVSENNWLVQCVNKIDVTDIGRQHDLTAAVKRFGAVHAEQNNNESTEKKLDSKDKAVISNIYASRLGTEFKQLYLGKVEGSPNEADKNLIGIIYFFTNCNAAQTERIFKSSALYRESSGSRYVQGIISAIVKSNGAVQNNIASNESKCPRYNGSAR